MLFFRQSRLSRIQILVDIAGKTKGKRFKSNASLWNPATSSRSTCERSILSQGGSVTRCEKANISGLPSFRPSVLEYLKQEANMVSQKQPTPCLTKKKKENETGTKKTLINIQG